MPREFVGSRCVALVCLPSSVSICFHLKLRLTLEIGTVRACPILCEARGYPRRASDPGVEVVDLICNFGSDLNPTAAHTNDCDFCLIEVNRAVPTSGMADLPLETSQSFDLWPLPITARISKTS